MPVFSSLQSYLVIFSQRIRCYEFSFRLWFGEWTKLKVSFTSKSTLKFWTSCLLLSHLSVRKCILWFDFWLTLRDKPEKSRKVYFLLIAETFSNSNI